MRQMLDNEKQMLRRNKPMLEVRDSLRSRGCRVCPASREEQKGNQTKLFLEKATSASSRTSCPWSCRRPQLRAADVLGTVVGGVAG
jgi:hypothetical protein